MDFRLLHVRLIAHIHLRVRNGELTERGLARRSGISQPHLHNVLKGVRSLSTEMADQLLRCLRIDLLELAAGGEPRGALQAPPVYRMIPCLDGLVGPGHPFPARESRMEAYPFPVADLEGLEAPVAVRLAPDPRMADLFTGGDVALLDRCEMRRILPDDDSYFALDIGGAGAVRRVRVGGHLTHSLDLHSPVDTEAASPVCLSDRNLLLLVRGRVARLVRRL